MFINIFCILSIVVIISVFLFYFFLKKNEGKDWIHAIYFIIILLEGTILFLFALFHDNDSDTMFSIFFVFLRSFSLSLASFIGNFNGSIVINLAKENIFFHVAFIMHYCAAALLTFLVIIKFFGKNILNSIRVFMISLSKKYIIIGCNRQVDIFLKNLSKNQKKHTIVIVQQDQNNKKNDLIDKGFAVVLIKDENEKRMNKEDFYKTFNIALKKAGVLRCKYETKVISMSEHDDENIVVARIITNYIVSIIKHEKDNGRIVLSEYQEEKVSKIKLDAYIMYSFLERAEHFSFIEDALGKASFFNPYKLNAYKFWSENPITKLIPSVWIDIEKARLKCKYKINNIFIGFGLTNKALLKASIINNQLPNIDFNALILCQNANEYEKIFNNSAVGLFDEFDHNGNIIKRGAEIKTNPEKDLYLFSPNELNKIIFKEANALTIELYDIIIKEVEGKKDKNNEYYIQPCDYATVIIALENDKLSIETALELRQKLYEADLLINNDDSQRIKIYVKIKEKTVYSDDKLLNHDENIIKCRIIPFGADDEILTEEYVINEKLDILAKNIANRYEGNIESATINEWNTCTQLQRESNRFAAMAIGIKLNLLGLDLIKNEKQDLDYIKTYHERYGTNTAFNLRAERKMKEREVMLAREQEKTSKNIPNNILSLKLKNEVIDLAKRSNEEFTDTPRNNLAKLEHQRWNAFYLANDWTKLPKNKIGVGRSGRQDGIAKQHACITTFNGLVELREMQKNAEKAEIEKKNEKKFIEAESLLKADTIRHDFNTMDFLLDLSDENTKKLQKAEGNPNKKYIGILTGSGYTIGNFGD